MDCVGEERCNDQHECHSIGATSVDTLIMSTCNCTGCNATDKGAQIYMKGEFLPVSECTIGNLGNASRGDYDTGTEKQYYSKPGELGGCSYVS